jgi:DNA repair exonuclease SbcCD ATPase subunit
MDTPRSSPLKSLFKLLESEMGQAIKLAYQNILAQDPMGLAQKLATLSGHKQAKELEVIVTVLFTASDPHEASERLKSLLEELKRLKEEVAGIPDLVREESRQAVKKAIEHKNQEIARLKEGLNRNNLPKTKTSPKDQQGKKTESQRRKQKNQEMQAELKALQAKLKEYEERHQQEAKRMQQQIAEQRAEIINKDQKINELETEITQLRGNISHASGAAADLLTFRDDVVQKFQIAIASATAALARIEEEDEDTVAVHLLFKHISEAIDLCDGILCQLQGDLLEPYNGFHKSVSEFIRLAERLQQPNEKMPSVPLHLDVGRHMGRLELLLEIQTQITQENESYNEPDPDIDPAWVDENNSLINFYEILGVSHDATENDIKIAYKATVKKAHPDQGGNAETFNKVHLAYKVLTEQRDKYDRLHSQYYPNNK